MSTFIKNLPKVELHCHIEGTFEPELMFSIAERNGISMPYANIEALRQAYNFKELQDFLDIYYQGMNVLQTEQDFFDLTWAYLERIHQDNVRHTEIFFDPQGHVSRKIPFEVVVNGISTALQKAEQDFDISSELIMCFLRHLDQDDAFRMLELAEPFRESIIGVGLDSSERGNPPEKFEQVFSAAREKGYLGVAHAGEEGPPAYIYSALDNLNVNRIDHGNSCLEDSKLVARLVKEKMPLTVCPLSNTRLCVVEEMAKHPLKRMLELDLQVTINSDDPAYFGGYMDDNFNAVNDALGLSEDEITRLSYNAIDASFTSDTRKAALHKELNQYRRSHAIG